MGYLIGLIITLVVISILVRLSVEDEEERYVASIICIASSIIIVALANFFSSSNFIASDVINSYKKGKYKEIIIIDEQDTTYKYVRKCKE